MNTLITTLREGRDTLPPELWQQILTNLPDEDKVRLAEADPFLYTVVAQAFPHLIGRGTQAPEGHVPTIYEQTELNALLAETTNGHLNIIAGDGSHLTVNRWTQGGQPVDLRDGVLANVTGGLINALGQSTVTAVTGGTVNASEQSTVTAVTGGSVNAFDQSTVTAVTDGHVNAYEQSTVATVTGGHVNACEQSRVTAVTGGHVNAFDQSTVTAVTGGSVNAFGQSRVTAVTGGTLNTSGEARVRILPGSGTVTDHGPQVRIWATPDAQDRITVDTPTNLQIVEDADYLHNTTWEQLDATWDQETAP